MPGLQEWIYRMEEGGGARLIKVTAALLVFVALALFYDMRKYKNFSSQEAMDVAQAARNLSEGKGYTTQFVRPLSIHLVQNHREDRDPLLKQNHPDLANPPVYTTLLAGLMKVSPMKFEIDRKKPFSSYGPERWITGFNQILFLLAAFLLFKLASRLFDGTVAWLTVAVFVGTELFWRFSVSGLPTMLLVVTFLGIAWVLVSLERRQREEENVSVGKLLALATVLGVLVGFGGMTRYSFALLIGPVLLFLGFFMTRHRVAICITALASFMLVMTPWLVRNHQVSGTFFGTAGFAAAQGTPFLQGTRLDRSLNPQADLAKVTVTDYVRKLVLNTRDIFQTDLPRMGGSWLVAFFLVGLLIPFKNPALSRLRIFLLLSLLVFIAAQALGRTHLSADSPEINSENLLVLLAPLVFMFGVGLFAMMLEQFVLPVRELRYAVTAVFLALACAPLLITLLQSRVHPVSYPPYAPPVIQETAAWMKENELVMSDIPWAVAWYGQRQSAWLTLNYNEDFYEINDGMKPVKALYFTTRTLDANFLSDMVKDRYGWGRFVLETVSRSEVPKAFPLRSAPAGFLPEQLFLTDWERWRMQPK